MPIKDATMLYARPIIVVACLTLGVAHGGRAEEPASWIIEGIQKVQLSPVGHGKSACQCDAPEECACQKPAEAELEAPEIGRAHV